MTRVAHDERSGTDDVMVTREQMQMRSGTVDIDRLAEITDADLDEQVEAEGGPLTINAGTARMVRGGPPVRELRAKSGLTQQAFAETFGLRVRTLQQWEQGARVPSDGAALYLMMIEHDPNAVARVVADVRRNKITV